MILYDVTNPQSLSHVYTWQQDLMKTLPQIPIFMIGNKIDLEYNEETVEKQASKLADRLHLRKCFTSAKKGTNMNEIFAALTRDMIEFIKER